MSTRTAAASAGVAKAGSGRFTGATPAAAERNQPKQAASSRKLKGGGVGTGTGSEAVGKTATAGAAAGTTRTVTKAGAAAAAAASGAGNGEGSGAVTSPPPVRKDKLKFALSDLALTTTLGTGTFGRVRLAYHKPSRKYHALKILKKSEIIRLKQVDHIKSEVRILSMVEHPFIVNLIGNHQDAKRLYMLLEYVPGGELFSHLRREGRFSNDGGKFYAAEIILAFAHLHSYDIVYRDLKPENLLITKTGHMKITDFGFAKVVADRTWTLCGTPEYLAPEIIQSKGHGKSVDWWAMGILIYEMLAGYPPFYDETPFGIYQKILAGRIDFPRHFDVHAKSLIRKLLTADRTQRLGCLRNGAEDIKSHKWFGRLNWEAVFKQEIPAPFIPEVRGENDTRNFDDYDDSVEDTAKRLNAAEAKLFEEFDTL